MTTAPPPSVISLCVRGVFHHRQFVTDSLDGGGDSGRLTAACPLLCPHLFLSHGVFESRVGGGVLAPKVQYRIVRLILGPGNNSTCMFMALWSLFLLLLTASASTCQQHSCNRAQVQKSSVISAMVNSSSPFFVQI